MSEIEKDYCSHDKSKGKCFWFDNAKLSDTQSCILWEKPVKDITKENICEPRQDKEEENDKQTGR